MKNRLSWLKAYWQRLIEPTAILTEAEQRQEARLLAGLSLAILLVTVIGVAFTFFNYDEAQRPRILIPISGVLLFLLPYRLSRRGQLPAAINALAGVALLLITAGIFAAGGVIGREVSYYYMMVIIFVAVFLSRTATILYVLAIALAILIFQISSPQLVPLDTIRGPVAFNLFGAGFVSVFTSFWDTREREKRTLLEASERKRSELLIRQEQQRVLRNFVAAVTHDFRNRLSTVEVNQHLLRRKLERGDALDSLAEHFDKTRTAVQQMSSQMENMSLIIGLENTTQTLVDLREIVEIATRRMETLAYERGVTLTYIPSGVPVTAFCNQPHIEVAIRQLIQNAIVYTPTGGQVTITLAASEQHATITVSDTGIGIAAEHVPNIFDPFYKVGDARTTSQAGLGLGLTIVDIIAETYYGTIEVDSQPGGGSTFRLTLPAQRPLG